MTQFQSQSPAGSLLPLRIIWAAMIMGVLMFFGVVLFIIPPSKTQPDPKFMQLLLSIAIGMLCVFAPLGYLIKKIIWHKGRDTAGAVSLRAYVTGKIIQLAMCEAVAFFALVGGMLNGGGGPHLIVASIAIVFMILSFPTGKPLRGGDGIQQMNPRS